jgi:hypothetical protein
MANSAVRQYGAKSPCLVSAAHNEEKCVVLRANAEEVSQADLRNVVRDVLIIL